MRPTSIPLVDHSFELENGGGKQDIDLITKDDFIEIPPQPVARLKMSYHWFYARSLLVSLSKLFPLINTLLLFGFSWHKYLYASYAGPAPDSLCQALPVWEPFPAERQLVAVVVLRYYLHIHF